MKKLLLFIVIAFPSVALSQTKSTNKVVSYRDTVDRLDSFLAIEAEERYEQSSKSLNKKVFIESYIQQAHYAIEAQEAANERKASLVKRYGIKIAQRLLAEEVWIGMTDKMVRDEFGEPDIKKTVTAAGVTETWTYTPSSHCWGDGCPILEYYMVFRDHKLIAVGDL